MAGAAFMGEPRRGELSRGASTRATESFAVRAEPDEPPQSPPVTRAQVDEAVRQAQAAQHAWAAMPPYFRLASLRRFPLLLRSFRVTVAAALQGVLTQEAALERVDQLARDCKQVTQHGLKSLRPVKHRSGVRVRAVQRRLPLGLVAVFPCPETGPNPATAVAALLAGNGLLLLADADRSQSAVLLAQLCDAARLPRDLVQVVSGPAELIDAAVAQADSLVVPPGSERGQELLRLASQLGVPTTSDGCIDPAEFTALDGQG